MILAHIKCDLLLLPVWFDPTNVACRLLSNVHYLVYTQRQFKHYCFSLNPFIPLRPTKVFIPRSTPAILRAIA